MIRTTRHTGRNGAGYGAWSGRSAATCPKTSRYGNCSVRGFTGAEQVRRNWTQIFASVPDLLAKVTGWAEGRGTVWTEWQMRGTRGDGTPHLMCGVIIFSVADDRIASARFYLEPLETSSGDVDAAVRAQMASRP